MYISIFFIINKGRGVKESPHRQTQTRTKNDAQASS